MSEDSRQSTKHHAQRLLERSIGPDAEFRPQQWEAIDRLVNRQERVFLVQRTGWGKSTVYFIATKLRREQGHGPTLIISPLLALMRNQIRDAEAQLDLNALTINSQNESEWADATEAVRENRCDVLLISPERLANPEFQADVLEAMEKTFGLLVVDEAHCISDWGHDFRPDYRRISRILTQLPDHIPVAATTATANDRVITDVTTQVPDLQVIRGDLVRDSLRLQTIELGSRAKRLAWITENVADLPSSGIIYCLTTDEVEKVASWLQSQGFDFKPYHGGMDDEQRGRLEDHLLANEVDGLVATNALGMGFNKPDLGWVIHFQRPPNLIRYYQEIGRAGRALDEAVAILLTGPEDDAIAEYFIEGAFPTPEEFELVLSTLDESEAPLYKYELLKRANISWKAASQCLDMLQVENAVRRVDDGFERTGLEWDYDHDRIEAVTRQRRRELARISEYAQSDACLTRFIDDELDGSLGADCGYCANCTGAFLPLSVHDDSLIEAAEAHYQDDAASEIAPRYYMPEEHGRSKIAEERKPELGRALSAYGDPGYGALVQAQIEDAEADTYDQALVDAAVEDIRDEWAPDPRPSWVTMVPSSRAGERSRDLAQRIATGLGLDYVDAVEQVEPMQPLDELANSYQERWNVKGAFEVRGEIRDEPVLLVSETVGSRWRVTEAALILRDAGCGPVYPFALAERTRW